MNAPQTTIACPSCGMRCMVPGGIFQFHCPGCQTLCRIAPPSPPPSNAPPSNAPPVPSASLGAGLGTGLGTGLETVVGKRSGTTGQAPDPAKSPSIAVGEHPDGTTEEHEKEKKPIDPIAAAAVAGGVLVALLLIFTVAAFAVMSMTEPEVAKVEPPPPPPPIVFREVNLPESTRQQIYRDIRMAERTTVGAKVPLPKDSDIGRFWQENMQKVMNREFTLHTLLNDIDEADLKEIIKEGNAKDW